MTRVFFGFRVYDGDNTTPPPTRKGLRLQSPDRCVRLLKQCGPRERVYVVDLRDPGAA